MLITVFIFIGFLIIIRYLKTSDNSKDHIIFCFFKSNIQNREFIQPRLRKHIAEFEKQNRFKRTYYSGNGKVTIYGLPDSIALYIWFSKLNSIHLDGLLYELDKHTVCNEKCSFVDQRGGIFYVYQCCQSYDLNLPIEYETYAHRTRPSIIVQSVTIHAGRGNFQRVIKYEGRKTVVFSQNIKIPTRNSNQVYKYRLNVTIAKLDPDSKDREEVNVTLLAVAYPETAEITIDGSNGPTSRSFVYGIRASKPIQTPSSKLTSTELSQAFFQEDASKLEKLLLDELTSALLLSELQLREEHTKAWNEIWSSNFFVSHSMDPAVPNIEEINDTFYAVLANTATIDTRDPSTKETINDLAISKTCYSGPYTIVESGLWTPMESVADVEKRVSSWKFILAKYDCENLLSAGPKATMQALLRSMGEIKVAKDYISLSAPLHSLHRELTFYGLEVASTSSSQPSKVSIKFRHISHEVSAQPQVSLTVHLTQESVYSKVFVCSAGCRIGPIKLSYKDASVPIFETVPQTPFLFIATNSETLRSVSRIHPTADISSRLVLRHDLLALHEHGHPYGGLPTLFWMLFGFLLIAFHLFLIRIICNELCSKSTDRLPTYTEIHNHRKYAPKEQSTHNLYVNLRKMY